VAGWILTFFAALAAGALVLVAAPKAASNPYFAASLPVLGLLAVLTAVDPRIFFALVFLIRPLLDPLLQFTKIVIMEHEIGAGNLVNLLVLALAFWIFLARRSELSWRIAWRWVLFLAVAAVAAVHSPDRAKAMKLLVNLATYLVFALLPFVLVRDGKDRRFWIKALVVSSLPAIGVALLGMASPMRIAGHPLRAWEGARLQGCFLHPNILAFYTLWAITTVFLALKSRDLRPGPASRFCLWGYLLALLLVLLATRTRSAWLACAFFFFLYGLLKERRYLLYTLGAPLLFLLLPPVRERLFEIFRGAHAGEGMNSFAWRMALWKSSAQSIRSSPVFGHGLGSFQLLSGRFFAAARRQGTPAHNVYLELLFEAGLAGLLSYVWIFAGSLREFWRDMRAGKGKPDSESVIAFCSTTAYLLVCASDNMMYYLTVNWGFWFFTGWALRSCRLRSEKAVS
jgi:O-antigen ligase